MGVLRAQAEDVPVKVELRPTVDDPSELDLLYYTLGTQKTRMPFGAAVERLGLSNLSNGSCAGGDATAGRWQTYIRLGDKVGEGFRTPPLHRLGAAALPVRRKPSGTGQCSRGTALTRGCWAGRCQRS